MKRENLITVDICKTSATGCPEMEGWFDEEVDWQAV